MILVLSDKFDKHADVVCGKLNRSNEKYFRFDLDTDSLKSSRITFFEEKWSIQQNDLSINSDQIDKVWVRRPFVEVSLEEANINDPGFKIWRGEWNKTLLGLYNTLKTVKWLNPLAKSYQAENKYLQMDMARNIGFTLPPLIVSNDKKELCNFIDIYGDVVLKLMNQEFYQDSDGSFKGLYVNKVSEAEICDFGDINENPIVLQAYVEKDYEVRYTVVGQDHHVCQIQSQKSKLASIDWRRYDIPNTPHHPIEPPSEIREKVNKFMTSLDLEFGALDFIVTPSGEWHFLEINTMGQWLWIEDLTGLGISDSIVSFLSKKKGEK
ncbi:MvdC/MvdD family ATP grasp protein [Ectopseudomonas oleovorans]|uniref:MvdC/MvdD family ATP grasp protein n=1 Tax=Ectopseudomonas oleovorans TaxID=301 RepID=UPI0011B245A7|nr:hypothetical protein [Pseudomonas indoloxydans]